MANIALERIEKLFQLAEKRFDTDTPKKFADRYVELARRISMKAEKPIHSDYRKKFCRTCESFLRPRNNCKIQKNRQSNSSL